MRLCPRGAFPLYWHNQGALTGTLSLALGGFDIVALAVRLFDPSHPLAVFNQRLHSSRLYNGFQFVVAAFSAGAHLQMRRNPRVCFVAGTLILTASGLRAIENIRAGDRVLATNPEGGVTEEKAVVERGEGKIIPAKNHPVP